MSLHPPTLPFDPLPVCRALAEASAANDLWDVDASGVVTACGPGVRRLGQRLAPLGFQVRAGEHRAAAIWRQEWVLKVPLTPEYARANSSELERWAAAGPDERAVLMPVWQLPEGVLLSPWVQPITEAEGRLLQPRIEELAHRFNIPDARWSNVGRDGDRLVFFDYGYVLAVHWPAATWPGQAPAEVSAFWYEFLNRRTRSA